MRYKYRKELTDEQNKKLKEIYKSAKTHANIKESINNSKKKQHPFRHQ